MNAGAIVLAVMAFVAGMGVGGAAGLWVALRVSQGRSTIMPPPPGPAPLQIDDPDRKDRVFGRHTPS